MSLMDCIPPVIHSNPLILLVKYQRVFCVYTSFLVSYFGVTLAVLFRIKKEVLSMRFPSYLVKNRFGV
jgi:hypothetical protein